MNILEVQNLCKTYGSGEAEVHALDQVSFSVRKGEFIAIIGESGSGKSTLLNIVGGLDNPTSGKVWIDGKDVFSMSEKKLTVFRRQHIGFIFQSFNLIPELNVEQNLTFPLLLDYKTPDQKFVDELLHVLGLTERRKHLPSQLSGGQQQRVALARAIVTEPKVLLLDEPLSAIDAKLRRNLQVEIRRIQQDFGMTTIFVTHDQDEAMVMSDVIHLFHNGLIEQSGAPTEMYTQPVSKFAASFIGNYNILSAAEFEKACGEAVDSADVAIRPEIVRINLEVADESKRYHMEGEVINSLSHGNLMRYTILCNDVEINADIMFEKSQLLEIGQKVRLSIRKTNVIMLNS